MIRVIINKTNLPAMNRKTVITDEQKCHLKDKAGLDIDTKIFKEMLQIVI